MIEHNGKTYKSEEDIAKANGITPRWFYELKRRYGPEYARNYVKQGAYKYKGKMYTARQLEAFHGVPENVIRQRICTYGWSVKESVETPIYVCPESRRH